MFKTLAFYIAPFAWLSVCKANAAVCNGHSELCDRKYSNVTFVGAHDSPFVGVEIADNQRIPLDKQLALGVRLLQAQTHDDEGSLKLCHTHCFLRDAGPLDELLNPVKSFLNLNPTEVVTLLLTNPDGVEASRFDEVFTRVGLKQYAFAPEGRLETEQWPTLGEMVAKGTRLVVFMDYPSPGHAPYIINEFDKNIIETPYEYSQLDDLTHCPIDRPTGARPQDGMLLMNHWLQNNLSGILTPNRAMASVTNSGGNIGRHVESCQKTLRKTPTFILLDWVVTGDAMLVRDAINGLPPWTME